MRKARWAYNPGMATADVRSSQAMAALDARLVVDAIPGLAWSSRPDGSVEFFNGRWYEYTGLSPEQSQGWGWKAAVHAEDVARLLDRWGASGTERRRDCEVRLRRSDGDFQWFVLRREPLFDQAGAVVRWFGTGINIESRKRKELLGVAEKRVLEMIGDGASLREVLDQVCSAIDVRVARSVTTCYKNTDATSDRRGLRRISPHAKATRSATAERQSTPINRHLFTARTSGKRRTSPTKCASKGEVLSILHARAKLRGMFKSITGKTTTVSGHRQRAVPRTHPTPNPLDTRLRIVASFSPS
jgi:PAS domain S-box-containing protein